jgi:alpha-methylacyl-CoA racemase
MEKNSGSQGEGPLHGLKVLDFTTLLPGPYATLYLADMGATVLRISSAGRPDPMEARSPAVPETGMSVFSTYLGRGKQSMHLNLKAPGALAVIHRLIAKYDVLLEQFRPGVMARLGLDYESLKQVNPRLIYCSLTGYGQNGPLVQKAGHDINYLAQSGLISYSGRKDGGPALMGLQIADLASGSMNAVIGLLAAVVRRNATGEGQYIDVSMTDGALAFNVVQGTSFLWDVREPVREGERLNGGTLYDFYETRDGHYMSLGALEPQFFKTFCLKINRPDLITGGIAPQEIDTIKSELRVLFKSRTRAEWVDLFKEGDACVEPVLTLGEALNGPLAQARGLVREVELPGGGTIRQMANPIRFSGSTPDQSRAGVPSGTHTQEIMTSLGYSREEYETLKSEGVFD